MLMLTVKPGQYVRIGDNIKVCVVKGKHENISIGIDAPKDIEILRDKVIERLEMESKEQ